MKQKNEERETEDIAKLVAAKLCQVSKGRD